MKSKPIELTVDELRLMLVASVMDRIRVGAKRPKREAVADALRGCFIGDDGWVIYLGGHTYLTNKGRVWQSVDTGLTWTAP